MSLADRIRSWDGVALHTEDGDAYTTKLLPPLSEADIAALEEETGTPLPESLTTILRITRGFEEAPIESLLFAGLAGVEMTELFPHSLSIGHDGFGNYWVLDLTEGLEEPPVYYLAHDPAVAVYQSDNLEEFVQDVFLLGRPPFGGPVDEVHEAHARRLWRGGKKLLRPQADCLQDPDLELRAFAESLDSSWHLCDLRQTKTGDGFAWGCFGPNTRWRRWGKTRLFACQQPPPSFWQKLFRR